MAHQNPSPRAVTIASGQTKSAAIVIGSMVPVALRTPSAMTGSSVSFEVADEQLPETFVPLHTKDGTLYSVTIATGAARGVPVDGGLFVGWFKVKIVSSGAEAADRALVLEVHPVPVALGGSQAITGTVTSTPAASEVHLGEVHSAALPVAVSPTIATPATPYTALDNIGGAQTLASAVRVSGGTSILQSIFVLDRSNQKQPMTILILDGNPNDAGTTLTDNAAITLAAADISRVKRRVDITAADYVTFDHSGTDFATAEITAISKTIKAASGTSLYAVIQTTGTPTYAAGALTITFGFLPVN